MNKSKYVQYGNKITAFSGEYNGTVLIVIHCDNEEHRGQIRFIEASINNKQNDNKTCHLLVSFTRKESHAIFPLSANTFINRGSVK